MDDDDNEDSNSAGANDDALGAEDQDIANLADQSRLPQDYETPAASADDPYLRPLPPDHPLTDSNIDSAEQYDEDTTGATDVWEQHEANDRKDDALFGEDE